MSRNFKKKTLWSIINYSLIFLVAFKLSNCDKKESQYQGMGVGVDPNSFTTTKEMYDTLKCLPYDKNAERLIVDITNYIYSGQSEIKPQVWDNLVKLNPYRKTEKMQLALMKWSKSLAGRFHSSYYSDTSGLGLANKDYKDSNFTSASDRYIKILKNSPDILDARNNLALAQIHLKNDLFAQLEFETIKKYDTSYTPALINLIVIYERLGKSVLADSLSQLLYSKRQDIPAITFNAAWYRNKRGDYKGADSLMSKLLEFDIIKKHKELYALNVAMAGDLSMNDYSILDVVDSDLSNIIFTKSSFWSVGIVKKFGWWTSPLMRLIFIGIFILLIIIIIKLSKAIDRLIRPNKRGRAAYWTFFFLGSTLCILMWGLPTGGWWALFILFILITAGILAKQAQKKYY
jgi:tetratricopeptide (TPR) repeat protein